MVGYFMHPARCLDTSLQCVYNYHILKLNMRFTIKKEENSTIFRLNELNLDGRISSELKAEFLIQCPLEGDFIVDLSPVEACDPDGLSALLVAKRELEEDDRRLKIAGAAKGVMHSIRTAQLHDAFQFFDSVHHALGLDGAATKKKTPSKKKAAVKKAVSKPKSTPKAKRGKKK